VFFLWNLRLYDYLRFMKPITRKEEIIHTSAILFKEKGYSAVTMRDIANEMGFKAASLYNHIKSKQEILKNIILSLAEEFTKGILEISNSNKTSLNKLEAIIALHVNITTNNENEMASLNADWMHLEEQLDYYLGLREDYENKFRAIIKEGISKNEIIDIDVDVMLFSILSTLRSLYLWIPKKEDCNPKQLANDLSTVLLKGIAQK